MIIKGYSGGVVNWPCELRNIYRGQTASELTLLRASLQQKVNKNTVFKIKKLISFLDWFTWKDLGSL